MYAVINSGGKQHRVAEGDLLRVDRLPLEPGEEKVFDEVLFAHDGENYHLGRPSLEGARVVAEIAFQGRASKVEGVKFKRRKRYRRVFGHKQPYTWLRVKSIELSGTGSAAQSEPEAEPAEAETAEDDE
jgi:large subunit ribosomal protein L21